mmetsp:Transcript_83840/g.145641  ORF Transcript_83840/g.145641 Transcript_83840/m.145641 type:complete len:213 (-) Transcript_83840:141-779(-)
MKLSLSSDSGEASGDFITPSISPRAAAAYGWADASLKVTRIMAVRGTHTKAPVMPQRAVQNVSAIRTVIGCKLKEDAKTRGSTMLPTMLCTRIGTMRQRATTQSSFVGSKKTKGIGAAVARPDPKGTKFKTNVSKVHMTHKSTSIAAKTPPIRHAFSTERWHFCLMYTRICKRSLPMSVAANGTRSSFICSTDETSSPEPLTRSRTCFIILR